MIKWKNKLGRILLAIVTAPYSIDEDSIRTPSAYQIYYGGNIPDHIKKALVDSYIEIFSEAPWHEKWTEANVLSKIHSDLYDDQKSFIVVYYEDNKVKGFAWGSIVHKEQIITRATKALNVNSEKISIDMPKEKNILYCDEFAVLKDARRGIDPVRHILKMFLLYAYSEGVKATMFWSTPESKIVSLAFMMGYDDCGYAKKDNKEIIFILNKDYRSLLKFAKHFKSENIDRVMAIQRKRHKGDRG